LREKVVCDGQTQWHLYPELGLAAKRSVSRFHRAAWESGLPWLVPSADDLSLGADVRLFDAHTVVVQPRQVESRESRVESADRPSLQLVFADDGRLAERRIVGADGRVRLRMTIGNDAVRLLDKDGKQIAEQLVSRIDCPAPELVPDTRNLVVLPMPVRTSQHAASSSGGAIDLRFSDVDFSQLPESDAMALLAGFVAERNADRIQQLVGQRFFATGDRRLGFYALLLSSGNRNLSGHDLPIIYGKTARFAALADHPQSPLARYIDQHVRPVNPGETTQFEVVKDDGFVGRLSELRSLLLEWKHSRTGHETARDEATAVDRVVSLVNSLPNRLAWELLHTVKAKLSHGESTRRVAQSLVRFESDPTLATAARVTRIRWLQHAGDVAGSPELLRSWFVDAAAVGAAPLLEKELRETVRTTVDGAETWSRLVREAHAKLIANGHDFAAVLLTMDCWSVGDRELAEELRRAVIDGSASANARWSPTPPQGERGREVLLAELSWHFDRSLEGVVLLDRLCADDRFAGSPTIWRLTATLADQGGDSRRAAECREHAIALDIAHSGDRINLTAIRDEFRKLFESYQHWAEQCRTDVRQRPDVTRRVLVAADQWRVIEPDDSTVCQTAARVLRSLGEMDAAWEYLTTPIADKPGESSAWLPVARVLGEFGEVDRARQAFDSAFVLEPTNADILWEHAVFAGKHHRETERRELLRRIAHGDWQPRFQNTQQLARAALAASVP
jgi:tetratricopeptide (TPR) repeat protein